MIVASLNSGQRAALGTALAFTSLSVEGEISGQIVIGFVLKKHAIPLVAFTLNCLSLSVNLDRYAAPTRTSKHTKTRNILSFFVELLPKNRILSFQNAILFRKLACVDVGEVYNRLRKKAV